MKKMILCEVIMSLLTILGLLSTPCFCAPAFNLSAHARVERSATVCDSATAASFAQPRLQVSQLVSSTQSLILLPRCSSQSTAWPRSTGTEHSRRGGWSSTGSIRRMCSGLTMSGCSGSTPSGLAFQVRSETMLV